MEFFKRAFVQVVPAAVLATVFSLFGVSLLAVFVRAYAPSDTAIAVADRIIKGVGIFVFSLLLVRSERALWKGMAAGLLSLLFTTLLFGIIGGFHIGVFFLLELPLSAAIGGLGALCGVKLRKE